MDPDPHHFGNLDPHPDPHKRKNHNPDPPEGDKVYPHQSDADPQHCVDLE